LFKSMNPWADGKHLARVVANVFQACSMLCSGGVGQSESNLCGTASYN
jgi:hypothetical protein